MKQISTLLTLFAALSFLSCAERAGQGQNDGQQVRINAQITTKTSINYPSASEAEIDLSQLPVPVAKDFKIAITSGADTVTSYLYGSENNSVKLGVGEYKIGASYGADLASGWNSAYYHGGSDFVLSNSQTSVDVNMLCGLQTAFAFVRFDDNFKATFSNITALISTEHTEQPLRFVEGEKRIASFRPAKRLLVRVEATLKSNGKTYNYGINPVDSLIGGDLHVFNFSVESGDVKLDLTADNGVEVTSKSVMLESNWLASRYTRIVGTANMSSTINNVYGLPFTTPTDMVVSSNIGVKGMFLTFDASLKTKMGADSINLIGMSDAQMAIVRDSMGIVVSEMGADGMNYRINFKSCVNKLKIQGGTDTKYDFKIGVVDMVGSYFDKGVRVNVIPPRFERLQLNTNKLYNRFAYIPAAQVTNVSESDKKRFSMTYWLSGDNGATWRSLGAIEGIGDIYVDKLEPNKSYTTKITFEGVEYAERRAFTTTGEWAIPNGNFDNPAPSAWPIFASRNAAQGADFDGWATINLYTTHNKSSYNYFTSYPCVDQATGRTGKGAAMTIIGWGANAAYKCKRYLEWFQTKYEWTRTQDKTTAGKIFLGTYNYDDASEDAGQVHGLDVANLAKPKALSFWYTHNATKGVAMIAHVEILASDNTILGIGQYTSNEEVFAFKNIIVPINYSQSSLNKRATKIKLYFSPKSTPAVASDVDAYDGTAPSKNTTIDVWDGRWYGATMVVDDVALVYPSEITDITIQ